MGFRYIGSKTRIANSIMELLGSPSHGRDTFVDAFCGTGAVAEAAANRGWKIKLNDQLKSCVLIAQARVFSGHDVRFLSFGGYEKAIAYLNKLPPIKGFFWREYSPASVEFTKIERKYFTITNAMKIDAIRAELKALYNSGQITAFEHTLLLADLISAVNNVANIAGTYGCFLSKWTNQAAREIALVTRNLKDIPCEHSITRLDVFDLQVGENDIVYYDPPYTKRQYASYYHIPETLAEEDEPIVEGVSGLRPWKHLASPFCYKVKALSALRSLIENTNARKVLISYSDEGHIALPELMDGLSRSGTIALHQFSDIGRYRPNKRAASNKSDVNEYLIEYQRY